MLPGLWRPARVIANLPEAMLNRAVRLAAVAVGISITTACSQTQTGVGDTATVPPQPGDAAPEFSLPSTDGGSLALTEFRGESPVLLYFSMGPG